MKVILNVVFWRYTSGWNWIIHVIVDWESILYFACAVEILLSITEWNLAYTTEAATGSVL